MTRNFLTRSGNLSVGGSWSSSAATVRPLNRVAQSPNGNIATHLDHCAPAAVGRRLPFPFDMFLERAVSGNFDAQPVKRCAGGNEQALHVILAPTEVGTALGRVDNAQAGCVRRENVDAARPGHVEIAGAVDLHAVGHTVAVAGDLGPDAAVFQRAALDSRRKRERAPASCH